MKGKNIILIVEDSDEDYYTTKRAFDTSKLSNKLYRCCDGQEALDYLFHQGAYTDKTQAPTPNVILLDLNLPKKDGKEVLAALKKDPSLCKIPVIVLTTSTDEKDIGRCYTYGANSYIQKPVDLDRFVKAIELLQDYWFEIVILPDENLNN